MRVSVGRPRSVLAAAAGVLCAMSLAACGGGFDSAASGQHLINDYVKKFGNGNVKIKSVRCPGGVKEKVGGSYDCKVVLTDTANNSDHSGTITIHMSKGNKVEITGSTDIHIQ